MTYFDIFFCLFLDDCKGDLPVRKLSILCLLQNQIQFPISHQNRYWYNPAYSIGPPERYRFSKSPPGCWDARLREVWCQPSGIDAALYTIAVLWTYYSFLFWCHILSCASPVSPCLPPFCRIKMWYITHWFCFLSDGQRKRNIALCKFRVGCNEALLETLRKYCEEHRLNLIF